MRIQQIRNATLKIDYAGITFLVDPWLQDQYKGWTAESPDHERNHPGPLLNLPMPPSEILHDVEFCLVTHLHPDHFTDAYLPLELPLLMQNQADEKSVRDRGYSNVLNLQKGEICLRSERKGLNCKITKVPARHGMTESARKEMGEACGLIFCAAGEKKLYLAGDTVWYHGVKHTIDTFRSEVIILNCGDARLKHYGRLIMDQYDLLKVIRYQPQATVIASHMDSCNHAYLTRKRLQEFMKGYPGENSRLVIPADGEMISL